MTRRLRWIVAVPLAAAALVAGGTWGYIHLVEGKAPAALGLSATTAGTGTTTATGVPAAAAGDWTVTSGTRAGYRVDEVLFGQHATAVGRTSNVTGALTLAGTSVTKATFSVDMASVASDQSRRDGQFRDRIMSVGEFPTSTFVLTSPIALGTAPADGAKVTAKATGDLTLRGVTKRVTFDVEARRTSGRIEVAGTIPVVFDEWGVPSPSFGPAQVEDHGVVEFLLVLTAA